MKEKQKKKISLSLSFMTNSRHVDSEEENDVCKRHASMCREERRKNYACILRDYLISH
jgi:hypothetical protein